MDEDRHSFPQILAERYEIEGPIGRGGMATVYLARDRRHDRRVAIKVLNEELSQTLGAERFLREVKIAAQLTHPHILPLHDSGEVNGILYYVMPYVEGETLRDRLDRERQLPQRDAVRIACEVASALDYAHRHGILHRDIKPENILLEEGHAILADFGIARALGSASAERLTSTGLTIGTPVYMSPEQSSAEPLLDGRSDVYSLASVLYEMLAGEPPFTGTSAQAIIAKRLTNPPPRIRTVRQSVPQQLEQLLLRALDRVPADRFATAEEFRDALASCAQDSVRVSAATRRRTAAVAVAALAVIMIFLTAGWLLVGRSGSAGSFTTVAVLPLSNASADPEHAFLAEGLTDALIGELVGVRGVRVISRTSVMRYASGGGAGMGMGDMSGGGDALAGMSAAPTEMMAGGDMGSDMSSDMGATAMASMGPPKSLMQIATELGADVLVQGSLAREGDSIRVAASLIRPASLQNVWQGSYVRHVRDLFMLQRELATAITGVVARGAVERTVRPDVARVYDPAAHEAYLKGAYFQAHWKLPQAITSFERAVQTDPTHAPAQAGLARAYYFLAFFGDIPPTMALGAMRRAANAALEQDSLLAEAHGQLALVKMLQEWDWDGAERHFRRALEISPGHAQIRHDYAHFLLGQGRHRESLEQTQQAVALDPANPMLTSCLGWHSLFDGQHEHAIRFASEAHDMMPDHWAQVVLGWAYLGQNKGNEALAAFREAARLNQGAFTQAALGHALAVVGNVAEARRVLAELLDRADREYVSPYDIATVYAGLGESDPTFRWLRRAAEERSMFIVHVGWDSRFDRVRDDMRFADLMDRELKLPVTQLASSYAAERRRM